MAANFLNIAGGRGETLNETHDYPVLGRRRVLIGALALTSAGAMVRAEGETEIAKLFREWRAAHVEVETSDDEAGDRAFDRMLEIADRLANLEPETVEELARKVCAWAGLTPVDDDAGVSERMNRRMIAELRALAGNPILDLPAHVEEPAGEEAEKAPPLDLDPPATAMESALNNYAGAWFCLGLDLANASPRAAARRAWHDAALAALIACPAANEAEAAGREAYLQHVAGSAAQLAAAAGGRAV